MNEINTKNSFTQLGLSNANPSKTKANDELGQAEFLELMTAQLRFQDPLEPMENGDFLGQMAQFGTVSGVNELNTSFNSLSSSFQSNQALQASTMVGRKVLIPSENGYLASTGGLSGSVELEQSAKEVTVRVTNATGQLIHHQLLGAQPKGLADFTWDGLDDKGAPFSAGKYTISAEVNYGTSVSAGEVLSVVDVESVTIGKAGQDLTLSISGLGDISMADVRKIF
ncbi:MAG: flagellar basal-body rod modification protein FlgD [Gammaproteobacteria bacterium]|jgi:flagellar basal-body rod modification protein FlgD